MEYLLNDSWLLADLAPDTTREAALAAARMPVDLPHDALIGNTAQLYRDCDLWYFRTLTVTEAMLEQVVRLSFDGVYMDCDVWADDRLLCTHHYGYTSFQVDLHLDGATPLTATPITLTLTDAQGCVSTHQLMFDKQSRGSCAYPLTIPGGVLSASFVFLPGCRFDFYGLRFSNSANSSALFPSLMR